MLRPFCYANIATGILLASIVLIPFGILTSAISDLMLANHTYVIVLFTRPLGILMLVGAAVILSVGITALL